MKTIVKPLVLAREQNYRITTFASPGICRDRSKKVWDGLPKE